MNVVERIVRVLFKGEDALTPEATKAEQAIAGFGSTVSTVLKSVGALLGGIALGAFFKKAVEEAQASRIAMGQLALAVDNSGASFKAMEPEINKTLAALARTTAFGDDDFAAAMQQMTLKTGDARWALNNLGTAADLAAAAGVPLEQAAQALSKAHEGNTKALYSLVPQLKGAADWESALADATRGAAQAQLEQLGPFAQIQKQFGEVAEAVGKAILGNEDFSRTGYGVADMLADLAEWIEQNGQGLTGLLSVGLQVGQTFSVLVGPAFRTFGTFLLFVNTGVQQLWYHMQKLEYTSQQSVGTMLVAFGKLLEKGGSILKVFGITVVEGMGAKMREGGEEMKGRTENILLNLDYQYDAFMKRSVKTFEALWSKADTVTKEGGEAVASSTKTKLKKAGDAVETEAKRINKILDEKLGPPLTSLIKVTTTAINDLGESARTQLASRPASDFAAQLQSIADHAEEIAKRLGGVKPPLESSAKSSKEIADGIVGAARSALDLADTFGVVDDKAKNALATAINLGSSLAQVFTGDPASGAVGIVAALGSLITSLGASSRERKLLDQQSQERLRDNTAQLKELTKGVGLLTLDVKGGDVASIESILSELVPQLAKGGSALDFAKLINSTTGKLFDAGLGWDSIVSLAKKLNLNILDKDGAIDFNQLPTLLNALKNTNTARPGTDFASQLDIAKLGFGVNKTSAADQIASLFGLAGKFSGTLGGAFDASSLSVTRTNLTGLFNDLAAGRLTEAQLGGLTGSQFRDFITDIISRIDALTQDAANTLPGVGSILGDAARMVDVVGQPVAVETSLADVLAGVTAQTDTFLPEMLKQTEFQRRTADATEATAIGVDRLNEYAAALLAVYGGADTRQAREIAQAKLLYGSAAL